jgi:hypothetical protein
VRRLAFRLAAVGLAATVALAVALDAGAHRRDLALGAYLGLVCALVLVWLAATVASVLPAARELHRARSGERPEKRPRPQQLEWLERQVYDAQDAGYELPAQFRPVVRGIATAALARRHGVVLEQDPARARSLVGDRVWELLSEEKPEGRASELPAGWFRALVDDLEAI